MWRTTLAIVVLGGLLRTKSSLDEWEKVRKHVKSQVICKLQSEQRYRVEDILDLSFQDLPYYLKPCFLYLGSFPENCEISKGKLIRLWIAEGFVPKMEKEDVMEDVAEQCLQQLVDRCMVQASKMDHTRKGVKTCRLHDLMREFCISKAKEEIFLEIMELHEMNKMIPRSSSFDYPTATQSRRIAVHDNGDTLNNNVCWAEQVHHHLRSLLCHGLNTQHISSLRNKNFTLLRVLELDFLIEKCDCIVTLPSEIVNLVHLRYLRVSGRCHHLKLPHSIVNLRNLHTLDLRGIYFVYLPWIISRLRRLRHLLLPKCYPPSYVIVKRSLFIRNYNLANGNLETLKGILAEDLIGHNANLVLTSIRNLEIMNFRSDREVSLVLESLISQLDCLRSLGMEISDMHEFQFPNLELLSQCSILSRLRLVGKLSQENFSFLPKSLAKLDLERFSSNQEKLAILAKLPNLRILRIMDAQNYSHEYNWLCSADGFPKLEILIFCRLRGLREWELEEGAMPVLKILKIDGILDLRMIPEGPKYVTTLRELDISFTTKEFKDRLEGEDFYKVCHIPFVSFSNIIRRR